MEKGLLMLGGASAPALKNLEIVDDWDMGGAELEMEKEFHGLFGNDSEA